MSNNGQTALITGASGGIGEAFARQLAAQGMHLILVARSEDKLQALASEIRQRNGVNVAVIAADLGQADAAGTIYAETQRRGITVDMLINNAGFSTNGVFETIPAAQDHQQVMVNVAAVVNLTHTFIPGMLAQGRGVVINVASTTSFYPLPEQAVYAASKAFVLSFSESLWEEYRRRGIKVLALCPGATATAFFDAMGRDVKMKKHTPDAVVRTALQALADNRHFVIPGLRNRFESAILPRLLPRATVARLVGALSRRIYS
jgi:short-subunit dehydrogenase